VRRREREREEFIDNQQARERVYWKRDEKKNETPSPVHSFATGIEHPETARTNGTPSPVLVLHSKQR
jgi:hypothetical protein